MDGAQGLVREILKAADIEVNGGRAWDLQVHEKDFSRRVLTGGSMALGESYMDGWWDCDRLDELITRILSNDLQQRVRLSPGYMFLLLNSILFNAQRRSRAYQIGLRHYDLGNDLYEIMLDKGMIYSCGYWKRARNLDEAQEDKLDLICRKIKLEKGMRVLDIGCGWGGFARLAAERYGANVVGITVSKEQAALAKDRCRDLPVEIRLQDYRDLDESFDRIVSVGMIEHVGYKNYRGFMGRASRCLAPDGLFLLHTIGSDRTTHFADPWTDRYIFPAGMVPSLKQLTGAAEGLFRIEDLHSFGQDYDSTLMAWHQNFISGWERIKDKYDDRFFRMWNYYLLSSAASFRSGLARLWQIVLAPPKSPRAYESIRDA